MIPRRKFLRNVGLTLSGLSVLQTSHAESIAELRKKIGASDKINVGLIGCKGMGWSNLSSLLKQPQVNCLAICDIDDAIIDMRKADLAKQNIRPQVYKDYRKLLDNKDIDVVVVGTPDHWHCLMMTDACAAGKDVYVEKPVANSVKEAQQMVAAAEKYQRIVQVGQWQRSQQHFNAAIDYVHSGKLGKILVVKAWMYNGNSKPLVPVADAPVPAGVDYNMWLGPAEHRPFNKNRFHYEFRWFWDYAGGLMTDWGVHLIDMALLGMKATAPKAVTASGGKYSFPGDARETPDILTAAYEFDNFQLVWEHAMGVGGGNYGQAHGIAFVGENGTLVLTRGGWEVRPEKTKEGFKMEAVAWQPSTDNGLDNHTVNFIQAVTKKDASLLHTPIQAGAHVAGICHMGNIAYRTGEKIHWNDGDKQFDNKKANNLLANEYHNGWKFPKIG
jgi:predicted dehydrogenase